MGGTRINKKPLIVVSTSALLITIGISAATGLWVIMALPIGFLFGFFLQKGDLCGAAGCSEVLVFRSWDKLYGIWICIITCMAGVACLDFFGWITLNPRPLYWVNNIVGGLIFGAGSVLAGGCITGCLYKSGTGNLNSLAAIFGMPIGLLSVWCGFFNPAYTWMTDFEIKANNGGPFTLTSLTGISYRILTLIFLILTLLAVLFFARRKRPDASAKRALSFPLAGSWKHWKSGIAIGILAVPAYLCAARSGYNYPHGTTGGLSSAILLVSDKNPPVIWTNDLLVTLKTLKKISDEPGHRSRPIILWIILLWAGLIPGSWVSARFSGQAKFLPKPRSQILAAFAGGILLGLGAGLADGCFYGNVVSGWALMSVGGIFFGFSMLLSNWVTTYWYLMGGGIWRTK
ncbi:MAG: YeeE/YedE thiosulfate transporter family protein [Acidobacteriota bacterium]